LKEFVHPAAVLGGLFAVFGRLFAVFVCAAGVLPQVLAQEFVVPDKVLNPLQDFLEPPVAVGRHVVTISRPGT
jgi:hypothetical protein